jgi:hypothetical protein
MKWVALATWVATAGGGFVLLGLWLKHGGMQQGEQPGTRIRAGRILSHFGLAAAGLVVWVVYCVTDPDGKGLAWVGVGLLAVVALLGFSMLAIWLAQRGREPVAAGDPRSSSVPAEQRFPVAIVGGHGVLAATTLVLALLVALGVGD